MKQFLKEWRLQLILLVVILVGILLVLTQSFWAPRVYGEYLIFRMRNSGISNIPKRETIETTVANGKSQAISSITFQVPWLIDTNVTLSTTTALWLTNADNKKIVVYARGKQSYDAYAQILGTTPADAHFFGSTTAFTDTIHTLEEKRSMLFSPAPIYTFETANGVRGFVSLVNATSSTAVLFTPSGNEYEFAFGNDTREQIEQTLQSIKE